MYDGQSACHEEQQEARRQDLESRLSVVNDRLKSPDTMLMERMALVEEQGELFNLLGYQ